MYKVVETLQDEAERLLLEMEQEPAVATVQNIDKVVKLIEQSATIGSFWWMLNGDEYAASCKHKASQ